MITAIYFKHVTNKSTVTVDLLTATFCTSQLGEVTCIPVLMPEKKTRHRVWPSTMWRNP